MNIICFETEWLYNHQERKNRFNLNCRPVLQCLKDFYGCDFIYRNFLTKDNLAYYMKYFNTASFKNLKSATIIQYTIKGRFMSR